MPPSRVRDLRVDKVEMSEGTVKLSWTSPGDDGSHGQGNEIQKLYLLDF